MAPDSQPSRVLEYGGLLKHLISLLRRWVAPVSLLLLLAIVWEIWVRWRDVPRWFLPPPSAIAETLVTDRTLLLRHAGVTLSEVLLGFALALVTGVALGAAIEASSVVERALYPLVIASQTIPVIALAPLFLIWFGYGLLPKVLITALIGFFPIAVNTVDGLRQTDSDILDLFHSLGASRWTRFRLAKLPSALPFIFSGAKIAVAVCVIGAVFGELFGSSQGLGYLLDRSMSQFLTARVFASIALLSVMGVLLFALVSLVERLMTPWRRLAEPARQ
jgi:ABC-type nitrate/sulfonate/bicarbonate transport system permease component